MKEQAVAVFKILDPVGVCTTATVVKLPKCNKALKGGSSHTTTELKYSTQRNEAGCRAPGFIVQTVPLYLVQS